MRMVSGLTILTVLDLLLMRFREMERVREDAARWAWRFSRSWRFLRRVSGTNCRSVLGFMVMCSVRGDGICFQGDGVLRAILVTEIVVA